MNLRFLISSVMALICLGAAWAVIAQHQELGHLRAERQGQLAAIAQDTASPAPSEVKPAESIAVPAPAESSSELLQLRSEVTRLTQQRQALANVRAENERLQAQVASRGTNATPGTVLPPGFIRKAQAQMVGYASPQDTIQSFLWAMQKHDFNTVLQSFTPEAAQSMQAQFQQPGHSVDDFFRGSEALVGIGISEQKQLPDGSIEAKVQMGLADFSAPSVVFRQVNGQWKVAGPF
jgi:hypothetical protein